MAKKESVIRVALAALEGGLKEVKKILETPEEPGDTEEQPETGTVQSMSEEDGESE